jgi:hypothetical protein
MHRHGATALTHASRSSPPKPRTSGGGGGWACGAKSKSRGRDKAPLRDYSTRPWTEPKKAEDRGPRTSNEPGVRSPGPWTLCLRVCVAGVIGVLVLVLGLRQADEERANKNTANTELMTRGSWQHAHIRGLVSWLRAHGTHEPHTFQGGGLGSRMGVKC